ncbi:GRF1-interacting factor 3-like [Panicum miliaceum]|uniref:GRF1-interacting factor 3-like n=1 Tax=Panicum miliaceum TaxID=4540 RepID=A0A3L6Q2I4_PANMI|nr:GRF1-interacting factor 3-like [Panicum miliaceum]
MQQQMPMQPAPAPAPPAAGITTEQIQKYLDENKQLILAILENQNLGKLAECAQYQAQLQKNLLYLAAIADAQPQPPQNPATRPQPMQADPAAASLQQSAPVPADGRGGKQDATAGVSTEPSGTESHKNTTGADHETGGDVSEKS